MARGVNAQLAVNMYERLRLANAWDKDNAWKGIALLLLTCKVWGRRWEDFHSVVVYRESNEFKMLKSGPSAAIKKGEQLSAYLAGELGLTRAELCAALGQYWEEPTVATLQYNNLIGHAFRSIIVEILKTYGNPAIAFEEEVDPKKEFPGHVFATRSKDPSIDIVARNKRNQTVALITTRWRYRHDRVDIIDEAHAYNTPAKRSFPDCRFYAMVGEFSAARLEKVLNHCPPKHSNAPVDATVHFQPDLITKGLGENGRMAHLKSLAWLIDETFSW